MKKIIFSILLFALIVSIPNFANAAPCNVTNLVFRIKSFTPNGGGGCQYLVDIGFDIEHNGGNKYIYAHLWQTADYPAWGGTYGSAPTTASLNGSNVIGTIQINIGTPDVLSATYIQSGTTVMLSGTLTKTTVGIYDRYLITNVTLNFTSCPPQLRVKADVWASQSGNGSVVHCINGGLEFVLPANNFTMSTLLCQAAACSLGSRFHTRRPEARSARRADSSSRHQDESLPRRGSTAPILSL